MSIRGERGGPVSDGVGEKLWQYRNEGYLILGISNQGGVAFGHKTPEDCNAEIARTLELFERNPFHGIKCAYHHVSGNTPPYNHRLLLRKPDIGMLTLCEYEIWREGAMMIDWDNSLMVGDHAEDEELAKRAAIRFIHADVFFARGVFGRAQT